jgi:hypothetical protein
VLCDGACVTGTSCSPDGCNVPLGMISNFEQGPGDPVVIAQDSRVGSWERFWDETNARQLHLDRRGLRQLRGV